MKRKGGEILNKEEYILKHYGKIKAKDLAKKLNMTIHQVYGVARRNNITQKQNQIVNIDNDMHQIIISGILGDGRIKKNGKFNYYYSECHAMGEQEYLLWKKDMLKDLTKNSEVYKKNYNNKYNDALEFTSLTTPSLIPYSQLSKKDCIIQLDELGLLLLILDDGWGRKYTNGNGLCLSFNNHYIDELYLLKDAYNSVLDVNSKVVGKKIKFLSFSYKYEYIFKDIVRKYNMQHLDVVKKKMSTF